VGRRLRMTAELSDWLGELSGSQPDTAAEAGAALVALMTSGQPADLAAVDEPAKPDLPATVDDVHQRLLADLQLIRRLAAEAASARHRAEEHLGSRRAAGANASELGPLEAELAAAGQREEQLSRQSRRLQQHVDYFRTARETAKATYTAAEAQLRVASALADMSELDEVLTASDQEFIAAAASAVETIRLREAVRAAEARLQKLAGQPDGADAQAQGLLELRADPLGTDIRIVFAVEPADTVTLLAVLEGPQARSEHGAEALRLAGGLLTEIREHGWPADVEQVALADPAAFLEKYFAADDGSIVRRAAVLVSTVSLSRLREDQGLTIAEVSARSGLSADRVAAMEQRGLREARVHEAVAVARALGARLELPGGNGSVAG
jgi:phage shock protein A